MKNNVGNKKQRSAWSMMNCGIFLSFAAVVIPLKTQAHAFMENPKARQSICQAQAGYWWPADGSGIPNQACRAAFLESGYVQFVQEHEISVNVADYHHQQAVEAAIPDGTLCSAGSHEKRGLNLASPHWQKTKVMPNAHGKIQIRFNAKTPHNPSFWQIYLSKPSFNASTDVLRWQDLELVQEHGNIDFIKDPDGNRYYDMEVNIPEDRVGDALLYSRWQRNDVVGEGFYNCSDVTIVRNDVEPDQWQSLGYFVNQGHIAKVDDVVWLRLFNIDGQELINQSITITDQNIDHWQASFAELLNTNFSQQINVGVKDENDIIRFDGVNIFSNQVWSVNSDNSFALSVIPQSENTAPVVQVIDDQVLNANQEISLHVHAFDDQNDALSFTWNVPEPLIITGTAADITLSAGDVINETSVIVSVHVSDGKLTTSQSFNVTIYAASELPLWSASQSYNKHDQVSYQTKAYQAKWWNINETPLSSNAWQPLELSEQWHAQVDYQTGDKVIHEDVMYEARWWTRNEEPGGAEVWKKL